MSNSPSPEAVESLTLRRWLIALVLVGVAWRTLRYLLQFPIWGDEAYVCLNFLDRDLLGLTRPLRFVQVAPILFLWLEWLACHVLGGSELALRLIPYLAGVGGLLLFVRLARRTLDPLAATLAVGLLAAAYYPVRHGCEIKPYSFDLLMSVALLIAARTWLRQPERWTPLACLVVLGPLAMTLSYPSIFVAGSISLVLLPTVWRERSGSAWGLYVAYNGLLASSFVLLYFLVGTSQYGSTGGAGNWYWQGSFPPVEPLELLKWLALIHTGNMLAYPVGGPNGLSAATFLLCLAGVWQLKQAKQWQLLALCLVPFALTLTAAALHRYPYGGSARIAQHLAPAICLLAGLGTAALVRAISARWTKSSADMPHPRLLAAACVVLLVVGVGGLVRDVTRPYKTDGDRLVRQIVEGLFAQAGPEDQIVIMDPYGGMGATFEWYLRQQPQRIAWDGQVDWDRLPLERGEVWCLRFTSDGRNGGEEELCPDGRRLVLVDHVKHTLQLGKTKETIERCELFRWKCAGE